MTSKKNVPFTYSFSLVKCIEYFQLWKKNQKKCIEGLGGNYGRYKVQQSSVVIQTKTELKRQYNLNYLLASL